MLLGESAVLFQKTAACYNCLSLFFAGPSLS